MQGDNHRGIIVMSGSFFMKYNDLVPRHKFKGIKKTQICLFCGNYTFFLPHVIPARFILGCKHQAKQTLENSTVKQCFVLFCFSGDLIF